MIIIEALILTVLLMVLIFCSYTDCRDSLIRNSALLKAGLIIGTLDIAYYIIYGTQYLVIFLFNTGLLAIISLMLYALKIWAGGDSKLLLLISIAIPGRLYTLNGSDNMSGILIIVFSFLSAFFIIVIHSVIIGIQSGDLFKIRMNRKIDIVRILVSYVMVVGIMQVFDGVMWLAFPFIMKENWMLVQTFYCMVLLMTIYIRSSISMRHIYYTTIISWLSLIIMVASGEYVLQYKVSLSILIWAYTLLCIRGMIEKYNYQVIPTSKVKKGDILSASTVMEFRRSRVRGLPYCMTEDLEARLTEEEADSVHRWEKSKYGNNTVIIVRKIPFAVFLTIGTLLFFGVKVARL